MILNDVAEERNAVIENVLALVDEFGQKAGLELPKFSSYFSMEPAVIHIGKRDETIFDAAWAEGRAKQIGEQLYIKTTKKIISQLGEISSVDDALRGSSWAVAEKLTARLLFGITNWSRDSHVDTLSHDGSVWELDTELGRITGFTFDGLVSRVREVYEDEYMRYRVWREEDVKTLFSFLFIGTGAGGREGFENGQMEHILDEEFIVSMGAFIRDISGSIESLWCNNCTEVEYPETREVFDVLGHRWVRRDGDVSCIFSEYIPVELMMDNLKAYLYDQYVELHKSCGGKYRTEP